MIFARWLLFFTIGLFFQAVTYILYPFVYLAWSLFIYRPIFHKETPSHEFNLPSGIGTATIAGGHLLKNADNHGALSQYGFIQKEGLELLQVDGSFIRKYHEDGNHERDVVSGDVVVAWYFANSLANRKASDEVTKLVTDTYIKNLGTLSYDEFGQGYVSARCSNFGVNIALDSDVLKLSQPSTGPQYYTTAAALASAYHLGFKYKALFWTHWLVMGGWYWAWAPMIYPDQESWWYIRDITMKSLYVQLQVFGPRWWITKPMKFINDKITSHENDLFNAMMKRPPGKLPAAMDAFFSQREDASSNISDRMSAYIPAAIRKIYAETKWKD